MKSNFSLAAVLTLSMFIGTTAVTLADDMSGMAMSTPAAMQPMEQTTPAPGKTAKKAKKKVVSKAVWVCPMGDYSGPRTKDGKCPKCGMDLVEKTGTAGAAGSSTPAATSH